MAGFAAAMDALLRAGWLPGSRFDRIARWRGRGSSAAEYASSGDWIQRGSQYGVFGNGRASYSLDAFYRTENGQRQNSHACSPS